VRPEHAVAVGAFAVFCAVPVQAQIYTRRNANGVVEATNAPDSPDFRLTYPGKGTLIHSRGFRAIRYDGRYDSHILDAAATHGVSEQLVKAVIAQESEFDAMAVSSKGARGLMQLMPPTALRFGVSNIWDPKQNIEGGARYMRFLLDLFSGDVKLALAGYNAGEGAVFKYGYNVPPYNETQEYVRRIGRRYSLIRDLGAAANANHMTRAQVAKVQEKDPQPLNVYERSVFMARLPDGRLQLVSQ
jgi:soluble lytic murein transglycosylase-like protein